MSFMQISQAMSPFCVLCLFYFFYRLNRYEKFLMLMNEKWEAERMAMQNSIDILTVRAEKLEKMLVRKEENKNAALPEDKTKGE